MDLSARACVDGVVEHQVSGACDSLAPTVSYDVPVALWTGLAGSRHHVEEVGILTADTLPVIRVKRSLLWTLAPSIKDFLILWALTRLTLLIIDLPLPTHQTIPLLEIIKLIRLTFRAFPSIIKRTILWTLTKMTGLIVCLLQPAEVLGLVCMLKVEGGDGSGQ